MFFVVFIFFFKQKTAYEMRISDWSSDVCSSDLSSNFERLLFDAGGRDGKALAEQMKGFEASKAMRLTNAQRDGASALFTSARVDADAMTMAMRWAYDAAGQGKIGRGAGRERGCQ